VAEPKIFVNIASYRDTECQWTVRDLFEKAINPDKVFVGICWQFVPGEDDDCFKEITRPDQVRVSEFHASESRGVCWARSHSQKLWNGEEFTLQIDSHMRFVTGWDQILLEMHKNCPSEKSVMSTYPIAYEPPDNLSAEAIVTIKPKFFDKRGMLMFRSNAAPPDTAPSTPTPSAFCAAGLLFGPSKIISEVPYDPHIYFQGEEITLAVRLWTNGWDIFTPNRLVAYHDYTNRPDRIRHWRDETDWVKLNDRSLARVRHLLEIEVNQDSEVLTDIDKYGLGRQRSLAEFESFSNLDFKKAMIDGKTEIEPDDPKPVISQSNRVLVFTTIWEQNGWGSQESRSGPGSTLNQTIVVREGLQELFEELHIEVLADACCGDFNWMNEIAGNLNLYLGFDIVDPLIAELAKKYKELKHCFFKQADVVADALPNCNAIIARDCLTHLSTKEVQQAIRNFRESGSTYLIATTHPGGGNTEINTGGWHPMELTSAPFSFPAPIKLISEGLANSQKSLGVWRLSELSGLE
jgi:hypothetical protein